MRSMVAVSYQLFMFTSVIDTAKSALLHCTKSNTATQYSTSRILFMIDICANLGIILCSDIRWGLIITATATVVAATVVVATVTSLVVALVVAIVTVVSVAEVTTIVALAFVLLFGSVVVGILR